MLRIIPDYLIRLLYSKEVCKFIEKHPDSIYKMSEYLKTQEVYSQYLHFKCISLFYYKYFEKYKTIDKLKS